MISKFTAIFMGLAVLLASTSVYAQSAQQEVIDLARDVESVARRANASEATFRETSALLRSALARLEGQSGNNPGGSNCAGRLARLHSGWSSDSLRNACNGAGADCVVSLAEVHSGWSSDSLNNACKSDFGNCAGRLATLHSGWSSDSLKTACANADADCVIDTATTHSGWSSDSLNNACRF